MIICRECGHHNPAGEQFCESCGSFLEWTGAAQADTPIVAPAEEDPETNRDGILDRVKRAVEVDDDSVQRYVEEQAAVAAADAALAKQRAAELAAQQAAIEAAYEQRRRDEAAAAQAEAEAKARAEADRLRAEQIARQEALTAQQNRQAEAERNRLASELKQQEQEAARLEAEAAAATAAAASAAEQERLRLEQERVRSEQERLRREEDLRRVAEEQRREQLEQQRARDEQQRLQEEARRAEEERKRAADVERARLAEEERQRVAEAERLRKEADLKRASALIAKPVSEHLVPSASGTGPSSPTSSNSGRATGKGSQSQSNEPVRQEADGNGPVTPRAPTKEKVRSGPKRVVAEDVAPGDLICAECGAGNAKERKFCKRCGSSLATATVAKVGFLRRILRKFKRKEKPVEAGTRNRGGGNGRGGRPGDVGHKSRVAFFKLNRVLLRIGAMLGVLAMLGFGVEPIRQKLQLPNVRQKTLDWIKGAATPVYDPIRPDGAVSAAVDAKHPPTAAIDLANNTYWSAAGANGGVGSTLTISFKKPVDLARFLITSGASGEEPGTFVNRPRPSELRLRVNGDVAGEKTVSLRDVETPQQITLKANDVSTLEIVIGAVYPPAKPTQLGAAITEVELFTKRKFGDDFETFKAVAEGDAGALVDDDVNTAWISAPELDGVGQSVAINFPEPVDVDRIRILGGRPEPDFEAGPRPNELQIVVTCSGTCPPTAQGSVPDNSDPKSIKLVARGVTRLQFQIRSVHGAGGGVAIREIQVQRKRPKVQ
jgi:hypothetical protein